MKTIAWRPVRFVAALLFTGILLLGVGHAVVAADSADDSTSNFTPRNFLYMASDDLSKVRTLLQRPDVEGVQVIYSWRSLETAKNQYNFSQIEKDLKYVGGFHKKLWLQIQDRSSDRSYKNAPAYLMRDPVYRGGIVAEYDDPDKIKPVIQGWIVQQWNPTIRQRYQALLMALATQFDGRVYGVNLPETSATVDIKHDKTGFTCQKYFDAEIENVRFARSAFEKSNVVQYVNFWPCEWGNDHGFMSRAFAFAKKNGVGIGGPDILPNKTGQMKNSYPYLHRYRGKLSIVAMAVQEPDLIDINPKTNRPFTRDEFVGFAKGYLGADIIFWSVSSPWLNQK
ncbi:MAG: hypothetical protein QOH56_3491 [Pseudonocardiales bacterium]|nr:hypothetical protein [Pseudonocardiales bacterium]